MPPLIELISKIDHTEIVVPEFQREYIWSRQQVKSLFESLYKKWPTGGFLFWKVKKKDAPPIKNVVYDEDDTDRIDLILDGQQRLTALFLIIKGIIPPFYNEKEIQVDPRNLYFNILEENFQYYQSTIMKNDPAWQQLTWFFTCSDLDIENLIDKITKVKKMQVSSKVWRVYTRLKSINDIDIPIQTIPEGSKVLEAITIFDRINTQGTKLTKEELALAHIQIKWDTARREMKQYLKELQTKNFDFKLSFYVRCLTAVAVKSGRPETIHNVDEDRLLDGWSNVKKSLNYLIKILPSEAYIDGNKDLISSRTLVPMIAFLSGNDYHFNQKTKRQFLRWFYLVTLWSRYSSSPESTMDTDVRIVGTEDDPVLKLIEEMRRQRPVFNITPKDLEHAKSNTGFGKMAVIIAKQNRAIDWFIGTPLSGGGTGKYSIEEHHVFPSSILYREKYPEKKISERDKVNEIANKVFITQKTNRKIRNTRPIEYFPNVKEKFPSALEAQFIPMDKSLWKVENYEQFLEARRRLISKKINEYIKSLESDIVGKEGISDILLNEEGQYLEFKSTLRVDTQKRGIPPNIIEDQSLKTIAAFLNQDDGGILLIGIDDKKQVVGLEHDYETLGKKNRDGFVLHLTNIIGSRIGKDYLHNIIVEIEDYEGKDVAVIRVQKAKEFVSYDNKYFVRINNQTKPLSPIDAAQYILRVWN